MKNLFRLRLTLLLLLLTSLQLTIAQEYVIISEVMYDTPLNEQIAIGEPYSNGEFIELYNSGNKLVKLQGWYLKGGGSTEYFYFPSSAVIPPRSFLTLAYRYSNSGFMLDDLYQDFTVSGNNQVFYQRKIILSNSGEALKLVNAYGKTQDSLYIDGTTNKLKPDRLSAENTDYKQGNKCVSLQRKTATFNNKGIAIPSNQEWYTAVVTLNKESINFTPATINDDGSEDDSSGNNNGITPPDIPDIPTPISSNASMIDSVCTYPIIWFRTVAADSTNYYLWKDFSGNNMKLTNTMLTENNDDTEYLVPDSCIKHFNFNPALNISYSEVTKNILNIRNNLERITVMGIWVPNEENTISDNNNLVAFKGLKNDNVLFTKNQVTYNSDAPDLSYGTENSKNLLFQPTKETEQEFYEKSLRIATYHRAMKTAHSLWGEDQQSNLYLLGNLADIQLNDSSDFQASFANLGGYKGYAPELLVFDKPLSLIENRIFHTYLAIKYGLTLDNSYISAQRKVMWDYDENSTFNHRITGYARQDALGQYQNTSTTSYEEAPYYTYTKNVDSYDLGDPNNRSSRKKLLVMGCQPASLLYDREYVLFGDNDGSLAINENDSNNYKLMQRRWLLNTNITPAQQVDLEWTQNNLNITNNGYFELTINKPSDVTNSNCITKTSLVGKDGYLGWRFGEHYGTTIVKFCADDSSSTTSCAYGYKFDDDGKVYTIYQGESSDSSFVQLQQDEWLEIEKTNNTIGLRINGQKQKLSEQVIHANDANKQYFGKIMIDGEENVSLNSFRHGGFVNTGHQVELSYYDQRASSLADYKHMGYLIIDPTAEGNFSSDNIRAYPVGEIDTLRHKIVFNNVFWDTDGNGKDVFTFGYKLPPPAQNISKNDFAGKNIEEYKEKNSISVYYKDRRDLNTITVKVFLRDAEPYRILIHDISGRTIFKQECPGSNSEQFSDINLPYSGFFVVKVVSASEQYSSKIISDK